MSHPYPLPLGTPQNEGSPEALTPTRSRLPGRREGTYPLSGNWWLELLEREEGRGVLRKRERFSRVSAQFQGHPPLSTSQTGSFQTAPIHSAHSLEEISESQEQNCSLLKSKHTDTLQAKGYMLNAISQFCFRYFLKLRCRGNKDAKDIDVTQHCFASTYP